MAMPTYFLIMVEIPEKYNSEASRNPILQAADTFRAKSTEKGGSIAYKKTLPMG
jgi:hypothetical protein